MPVIVVGADTPVGMGIARALASPNREVRAFVSDPEAAETLRKLGVKVALGDVSDDSHIEGAALHSFSAVLITEAAEDARDRAFATTRAETLGGWAQAVAQAGVTRVIWVARGEIPQVDVGEMAVVSPTEEDLIERVVGLDEAQTIESTFTDE